LAEREHLRLRFGKRKDDRRTRRTAQRFNQVAKVQGAGELHTESYAVLVDKGDTHQDGADGEEPQTTAVSEDTGEH
jgi:hypothetical protein